MQTWPFACSCYFDITRLLYFSSEVPSIGYDYFDNLWLVSQKHRWLSLLPIKPHGHSLSLINYGKLGTPWYFLLPSIRILLLRHTLLLCPTAEYRAEHDSMLYWKPFLIGSDPFSAFTFGPHFWIFGLLPLQGLTTQPRKLFDLFQNYAIVIIPHDPSVVCSLGFCCLHWISYYSFVFIVPTRST